MLSFKNKLVRIAHAHPELRALVLGGMRRADLSLTNLERAWGGYSSFEPRRSSEDDDREELEED